MKLYILKDGLYHHCVQEIIEYSYMYLLIKDHFICADCHIKFPAFLALGFKIRETNHVYKIGRFNDAYFFDSKDKIQSIEV